MKRKFILPVAILVLIFSLSFMCFSAAATDGEGEDIVISDETGDPVDEYTDPPYEEYTDPPYEEEEVTDAPNEDDGSDEEVPEEEYNEDPETPEYNENEGNENNEDYNEDYDDYTVEEYYEDTADEFQNYNDNVAETAAPTETLYEIKHKIDTDLLDNSDWAELSNLAEGGDDIDFSKMKNDTSVGDDNGWIYNLGLILLIVGAAGTIAVLVWFYVVHVNNKKLAAAGIAPAKGKKPMKADKAESDAKDSKRQVKKRSKFDTGEVKIPKNTTKGKYKPKH